MYFCVRLSKTTRHFMLRYRVSLPGIKGFARVYELRNSSNLYTFHKQMRADMGFPQDQVILFKALGPDGATVIARYSTVDLGAGTVDQVRLGDTVDLGVMSFVYFYDTVNKKSVIVTLEYADDSKAGPSSPLLLETKGPNHVEFENGYVAFEDLPKDKQRLPAEDDDDMDDEDDADSEDDDDDTEEVYDEDEDGLE